MYIKYIREYTRCILSYISSVKILLYVIHFSNYKYIIEGRRNIIMEGIHPLESVKFHCNTDNNILEKGKFLFLAPTGGIGTGSGAIVVGDGKRECKDLPYFIDGTTTDKFNRLLYILFKNNLISNDDLNYIIGL